MKDFNMKDYINHLFSRIPGKLGKILHYEGSFDGNPEHLKNQTMIQGAVRFNEPPLKEFLFRANVLSVLLFIILYLIYKLILAGGGISFIGLLIGILLLFPHEILHASCYTEDVYMYNCIKNGALFVVSSEAISKKRFIFMSLLPNIVFGVVPFALFLFFPSLRTLGTIGMLSIATGTGDYLNAYFALTQMPDNALTFLYQEHSYWFLPNKNGQDNPPAPQVNIYNN